MEFTLRRINFFKGLFTSAEDWQTEQKYHIDRQRLHNTQLHVPGVVSGLDVRPTASGTGVQVSSGHAIDPEGRHLYLERDEPREIPWNTSTETTTLRVALQWFAEECDPRDNGGAYPGKAFIQEIPKVVLLRDVPPDAVTLATIKLAPNVKRVREADDPSNPKDNEIDHRERKRAGAIGARASLKDAATVVQNGVKQIGPRQDSDAKYHEDTVTWDAATDGHALHFASAYPVDDDGHVSWRLGCSRTGGQLKYTLFIRNHETRKLKVAYRVYRLD